MTMNNPYRDSIAICAVLYVVSVVVVATLTVLGHMTYRFALVDWLLLVVAGITLVLDYVIDGGTPWWGQNEL